VGIFRKSEVERRLDGARVDLAAAEAKAKAIAAREEPALADGASYAKWRMERDAAADETQRLTKLIAALEQGAEAARAHDEAEALRKRIAAARKDSEALAERIRNEGNRLLIELRTLMRDVAKATIETTALNAMLPAGEPQIPIADFLARDTAVFPRVDLKAEELLLWVRSDHGGLIGNSDDVTAIDETSGYLDANGRRFPCVKRRFRSTTYHPAHASDHPGNLHSRVRLPSFDGPGFAFDGSFMTVEAVAAMDVEPGKAAKKPSRPIQTELAALDAWPLPGLPSEAERNEAL
jgi:hypothetical protein